MRKWINLISLMAISLGFVFCSLEKAQAAYYTNSYDNYEPCVQPYDPCQQEQCDPCGKTYAPYEQCCDNSAEPCGNDFCCIGDFNVGVDFIYWKPCVADIDYAAQVRESSEDGVNFHDIHYRRLCLDWEPGFRLRGAMPGIWCDWTLSASYTYLHINDHCTTRADSSEFLISPLVHPRINSLTNGLYSEIKGNYSLSYQTWDLLAAYPCQFCGCNIWSPFIGIEGLILDQKLKTTLSNPSNINGGFSGETHWKSDFHAVGLKAGQDFEFRFWQCLRLITRGSFTLAVAEPDARYHQFVLTGTETLGEDFDIHDDLCCQVIPGFHIQLSLAYEGSLCNVDYCVKLGYEFLKWFNLPNSRRFFGTDDSDMALSSDYNTRTLGLHGLLLGLDVKF